MRLLRALVCWTWFTGLLAVAVCVAVLLALLEIVIPERGE